MSSTTNASFAHHSWQTPKNARTLRAYMALHNQEIAERLRELRGSRPQVLVASGIGASPRALQNWEAGIARPSWRNVERLAEYYEVPEEYILTGGRRSLARTGGEAEHPAPDEPNLAEQIKDVLRLLREARAEQDRISGLLERQTRVLERIEKATQRADDAAGKLDAAVERAGSALRSAPRARKPAASKTAPKRTPRASR